jgi:hypothetical protein
LINKIGELMDVLGLFEMGEKDVMIYGRLALLKALLA